MSAATKLTGPSFWAFCAGEDRERRDNFMRLAREAAEEGYSNVVRVNVQNARTWHRYLIAHMRYARGEV